MVFRCYLFISCLDTLRTYTEKYVVQVVTLGKPPTNFGLLAHPIFSGGDSDNSGLKTSSRYRLSSVAKCPKIQAQHDYFAIGPEWEPFQSRRSPTL